MCVFVPVCMHVHACVCVQWCVHECACMCVRLPRHIHASEEFFSILLDQQVLSMLLCLDSLWPSLHLPFRTLQFLLAAALLQTPERSDYHSSTLSPVVSFLSLTRILLPGTTSLFLSICYSVSSFKSCWETFLFDQPLLLRHAWTCACVFHGGVCMHVMCAFETLLSKYVWVKV